MFVGIVENHLEKRNVQMMKNKDNTVKKNKDPLKGKDKLRKCLSRQSRKKRKQKAKNNKGPVDPKLLIVNMKFLSLAQSLKHVKNSLPRERIQEKNSWKSPI